MSTKPKSKTKGSEKARKTEFSLLAPQAQRVSIAGDFNQWNPSSHPLQKDSKGTWRISLDLKPGKYEYQFLLDCEWQNDPNCDCFVENPFGTSNCLKIDDVWNDERDVKANDGYVLMPGNEYGFRKGYEEFTGYRIE